MGCGAGSLRGALQRDDWQVSLVAQERDHQCEPIAGLSGDQYIGPAHGERRGQRRRGSIRGCRLAGRSRK